MDHAAIHQLARTAAAGQACAVPAEHAEHGRRLLGLRPYTTPYEPSWLNRPADAPPYAGPMELYLVLPRDEMHIVYRHSRLHLLTTALTEISDDLHQERTHAPQASARRTRRLGNVGDVHHHARHTDHQQQRSGVISAAAGTVGTLAPAYPPGTDIEPGVEVLPAIPVDELSIAAPIPFVPTTMCANVPADVVTAAGLDPTPTLNETDTCGWRGSSLGVEIGGLTYTMAEQVAEHVDLSTGRSEPLTHLAWLRIGDHYAIERILKFDRSASCWLSLDLSIPGIAFAVVYPVSPSGSPVDSGPADSVEEICPVARKIAKKLLNHLDNQRPGRLTKPARPSE